MSTPPAPDPYQALGIAQDATPAQVKVAYRKLALKFHPDKVTDESQKASASENFHRIQQAYEILIDEEKRSKHDASVRLAELRKEVLRRQQEQPQSHSYSPYMAQTSAPKRPQQPSTHSYHSYRTESRTPTYESPLSPRPTSDRYENYRTQDFRPRDRGDRDRSPARVNDDDDAYDEYGAENPRSSARKHSHTTKDSKKHSSKSDPEKRSHGREKEQTRSRHERRKTEETHRKKDRDYKNAPPIVVDFSDSDGSEPAPVRRPATRDREQSYSVRQLDDVSDHDPVDRRLNTAAEYITRSMRSPRLDTVRIDHENVRRSSATAPRSPPKDSSYREERQRQRSEPYVSQYRNHEPQFKNSESFRAPPLDRAYSSPIDKAPTERRSKTTSSSKLKDHEVPKVKRSETMPNPSTSSSRRPDGLSRGESSHYRTEFSEGLATPATSPPKDKSSRTYKYVVDENKPYVKDHIGRDDHSRDVSPRTESRRPVSPPLERPERKSRSSSTKYVPTAAAARPSLPHLHTTSFEPQYASHVTDEPRSARPSPSRENSYRGKLYGEIVDPERRRASPLQARPEDVEYMFENYAPQQQYKSRKDTPRMETGRSSKSHRPAHRPGFIRAFTTGFG